MLTRRFSLMLLIVAVAKSLLGILCYLANPRIVFPSPQLLGQAENALTLPPELDLLKILVLLANGVLLLTIGQQNRSAFYLGAFFLTLGSASANPFLGELARFEDSVFSRLLFFLNDVPISALSVVFLWSFVREFPEVKISFRAQRIFHTAPPAILAIAGALFLVATALAGGVHLLNVDLQRSLNLTQFLVHGITLTLILAALIGLAFRNSQAEGLEKRRTSLFLAAALGLGGPIAFEALLAQALPSYRELWQDETTRFAIRTLVVNAFLLALPFAVTYSVLVHRILDVRLIVRKALRHLLGRLTGKVLLSTPLLFLVVFLIRNREHTLIQLFSGWNALLLLVLAIVCGLTLLYPQQVLESIDRKFFRERHNARRILSQLVYQIRRSRTIDELATLVCRGIDLALQLENAALMIADQKLGQLKDPRNEIRPLDLGSQLATWLHGQKDALEIDLSDAASALENLPLNDRHWLVDGRIQAMIPLFSSDGSLLAVLALGPKKSELPFLREDFHLLTTIASSSALAIELLHLKGDTDTSPSPRPQAVGTPSPTNAAPNADEQATECRACDRVYKQDVERCPKCKVAVENALIPYILHNIFRFDERIGTGGMAVVYRATDLKLGRTVAIKTLPRVSPEAAIRLQKEARTAATVSHIGLAAVYGLETWKGTPMLILELLEGGTLSDHLAEKGPLSPLEVIETGQTVALALERIHSAGILHRDIKPSNIGYTRDGAAKLLDFGIARIHRDLRRDRAVQPVSEDSMGIDTESWQEVRTSAGRIAGTLPYLSPEAVQGSDPTPFLDLWSLSVVLYEALIGENLFAGQRLGLIQLLDRLRQAQLPDITDRLPDCPPPLVEFFRLALHPDRAQRPQSGRALYDLLSDVRRSLER